MALVGFALAVLIALFWVATVALVFPRLLARAVCVLAKYLAPSLRVSIRALCVHPLSGSIVAHGVTASASDGSVTLVEIVLTCRWWRPWRHAHSPDDGASSHRRTSHEREHSLPPDPTRAEDNPAATFPAVFALTLVGVQARIVNNSATHNDLRRIIDLYTGASTPIRTSPVTSSPSQPTESLLDWARSHTTLRIITGAVYICDVHGDGPPRDLNAEAERAPLIRVLVDAAKVRCALLPTAVQGYVRRDAIHVSLGRLRFGVVDHRARDSCGGDNRNSACRKRRGENSCFRSRQKHALQCVDILIAHSVVFDYMADEPGDANAGSNFGSVGGSCDDAEQQTEATASIDFVLSGARFVHNQASISAAQDAYKRLFPSLSHLTPAAKQFYSLRTGRVPLVVRVQATPESAVTPLISVPYAPRESTWYKLRALGVRRWIGKTLQDVELTESETVGYNVGNSIDPACPYPALPLVSYLDIFASKLLATITLPQVLSGYIVRVDAKLHDVRAVSVGVVDLPLFRSSLVEIAYQEAVADVWNEPRKASMTASIDSARLLYVADLIRVADDVSASITAQTRVAECVRSFVPYNLHLTIAAQNGFVIRCGVESANACPDLSRFLDDSKCVFAECRGNTGSIVFQPDGALRYSPQIVTTRWELSFPNLEVFLVFPMDASTDHDASCTASLRGNQHRATHVGGSFASRDVAMDTSEQYQSIRIASCPGKVFLSGEFSACAAPMPWAVEGEFVRIEVDSAILDLNPYHGPYLTALVDNLVSDMAPTLSFEERECSRIRRDAFCLEFMKSGRFPTQAEAYALGLGAGRMERATSSFASESTSAIRADIHSLVIRLHAVPSADCPMSSQADDLAVIDMGFVTLSSQSSRSGISVELLPVDRRHAATLSPALCISAKGFVHPCLKISGWRVARQIYLDADGAPFHMTSIGEMGKIYGTLPAGNLVGLARCASSFHSTPLNDIPDALNVLRVVTAIQAVAESVDVVVPLCDARALDSASGFCHFVMKEGFRACTNNLSTPETKGHACFVVPNLSLRLLASASTVELRRLWKTEDDLRSMVQLSNTASTPSREQYLPSLVSPLMPAARISDFSFKIVLHERPVMWLSTLGRLQAERLREGDSGVSRVPHLWKSYSSRPSATGLYPVLELYDSAWWEYATAINTESSDDAQEALLIQPSGHEEAEIKVTVLSALDVYMGPRGLDVIDQYMRIPSIHNSDVSDPSACPLYARDVISLWRSEYLQLISSRPIAVKTRFILSIQSLSTTVHSPLSQLSDAALGSNTRATQFGLEHSSDKLILSLPEGLHLALVLLSPGDRIHVDPQEEITSKRPPFSLTFATVPCFSMFVDAKEIASTKKIEIRLRILGELASARSRSVSITIDAVRIGSMYNDLVIYASIGRVLCVYGLMARAISLRYGDVARANLAKQEQVCSFVFGAQSLALLDAKVSARKAVSMMTDAIYSSDSSYHYVTTLIPPMTQDNSLHVLPNHVPLLSSSHLPKSVLHYQPLIDAFGLMKDRWPNTKSSPGSPIRPHQAETPMTDAWTFSFSLAVLDVCILGETVLLLKELYVDSNTHFLGSSVGDKFLAREGIICKVSIDALSISMRDDVVGGILSVATSVASHTTTASTYLPILTRQDHATQARGRFDRAVSLLGSVDTRRQPMQEKIALKEGQEQPFLISHKTLSKSIRLMRNRSSLSLLQRARGIAAGSATTSLGASSADALSGVVSGNDEKSGPHQSGENEAPKKYKTWIQKAAHAAEFARSSTTGGHSMHESSNVAGNPASNGTMADKPEINSQLELIVLFSSGSVIVSYKHRAGGEFGRTREPDLRIVTSRSSGCLVIGAPGVIQSVLCSSRAISFMARNEYDCASRGSVARIRLCLSIAPARSTALSPVLVVSIQFSGIDLSLEAADLQAVIMFRDQFMDDIKNIGESLVTTNDAVHAMLRATRLESLVQSPIFRQQDPIPIYGTVAVDIALRDVSSSLLGFHPGDKAMRISHDARIIVGSAVVSEEAAAVLILGACIDKHSLVTSASHWSSEEEFGFPGLDVCGVQWSDDSGLPTQLKMTAGRLANQTSLQGVRNMLFASSGLLAFQNQTAPVVSSSEPSLPIWSAPGFINAVCERVVSPTSASHQVDIVPGSTLFKAVRAWERTKAVRMEVHVQPMSIGLVSGSVLATFEVGELDGAVEWNKLVKSGVQLHAAVQVPLVSLVYARLPANGNMYAKDDTSDKTTIRGGEEASLAVEFIGGRVDILKSQEDSKHKYIVRFVLRGLHSVVQPWQFMEDAAVWADEQDFIREVQAMHLDVAASSSRQRSSDFGKTSTSRSLDHRVLELGVEVGFTRLQIPLLADESRLSSRLSLHCREFALSVLLGDDKARTSQLAKVHIRSLGILWINKDLFNSSHAKLIFGMFQTPRQALNAHFGALHASLSLGSWVICPRQEVVLAIVDARLSRELVAARLAREKLVSISERLMVNVAGEVELPLSRDEEALIVHDSRLLFESIEVLVHPSPGYIEGLEKVIQERPGHVKHSDRAKSPRVSTRLHLPIPLFSIGLVRSPAYAFDLLDVSFSKAEREEFPPGVLSKIARLFSELFGAVASRTPAALTEQADARRGLFKDNSSSSSTHSEVAFADMIGTNVGDHSRDWSALVRFGEAKYVAREKISGKLQTTLSFYAGKGAGMLASTLSIVDTIISVVPVKATVVSAASPLFRLDICPELESACKQSLTLTGVKVVQGYAKSLAPHATVHVTEVKAELDILTLLLSREWMMRKGDGDASSTPSAPDESRLHHSPAIIAGTPSAQQAALSLASAAPSETRIIVVLGDAMRSSANEESQGPRLTSSGHAVLLRLRLSQPDGRVGFVVKRVHLGITRRSVARNSVDQRQVLITDLHFAVYNTSSMADWEHLSGEYGVRSLQVGGDISKLLQHLVVSDDEECDAHRVAGLVLLVHKLRFKCRRGINDALKLEMEGIAAALRVDNKGCASRLEATGVDAYISSSTVKTINRLRQLQSRLIRGLRPHVERLLLAEIRRESSRFSASMDSLSLPTSLSQQYPDNKQVEGGEGHNLPTATGTDGYDGEQKHLGLHEAVIAFQSERTESEPRPSFPGQLIVTGDRLIVTMHGFSFDDNQPQAKLLFNAYEIDFHQRTDAECDLAAIKRLGLRFTLMQIHYSDQRQHSVTVMSLPDPHLILSIRAEKDGTLAVDFVTRFDNPVDTSPSVSHYDYLRRLLSLYRSVSSTSLARTFSSLDGVDGGLDAPGELDSVEIINPVSYEPVGTSDGRVRWGGKPARLTRLVFAPRLRALGDLTPDVRSVLGWLGVGGVEALPAGLFDLIVVPAGKALEHVGYIMFPANVLAK
jgi:hypothetical protein